MKLIVALALCFVAVSAQNCPEPDGHFADPHQCDRYISCKDGVPSDELCADGLVFDEFYRNKYFPCAYPTEVDCGDRTELQPPQPTENCARAWGYFGSGNPADCGHFFNCVDRREFRISCPEGLAFSESSYRCDWPEAAPECDAEAFLGFSCPVGRDEARIAAVGIPRYASPRDCRSYFICVGQAARLQKCELGYAFNDDTYNCEDPENVPGCEGYYPPEELAEYRKRREERKIADEERAARFRERFLALNAVRSRN